MTAGRRRDANFSWNHKADKGGWGSGQEAARRWEEIRPSGPSKAQPQEKMANTLVSKIQVSVVSPNSQEESRAMLKDVLPNRSRWADIEVEDILVEDGKEGARSEAITERRQQGPRGGRRPKFPAAAGDAKVASPTKEDTSVVKAADSALAKVAAQGSDNWGGAWGGSGYASWQTGFYGYSDTWEPPSRADLDMSWRRNSNNDVPADAWSGRDWGSCRHGRRRYPSGQNCGTAAVGSGDWPKGEGRR